MVVQPQQQPAALPLLNHNNRENDNTKWEEDFAELLGYVARYYPTRDSLVHPPIYQSFNILIDPFQKQDRPGESKRDARA